MDPEITPESVVATEAPASAPAPTVETPAVATPAPVATESATPVVATDAGQPRDEAGRFAAAAAAAASGLPPAQTAEAVRQAIEEYEALLDDKPLKLRADVKIPVARNGQTEYVTLDELRKREMREGDYTRKTQAIAEERRTMERQRVEYEARAKAVQANRERLKNAYAQGGAALEAEMRHQELMESDPRYRETFDKAEEYDIAQQVSGYEAEQQQAVVAETTVSRVRDYIHREVAKYPGLDPVRIENAYARALVANKARLHADDIDALMKDEHSYIQRPLAPVMSELEALKREIAGLKASREADTHNATTSAAIDRAKAAKVGVPGTGAAPAPAGLRPFDPEKENIDDYKRKRNAVLSGR